jgi:hypothetical protein
VCSRKFDPASDALSFLPPEVKDQGTDADQLHRNQRRRNVANPMKPFQSSAHPFKVPREMIWSMIAFHAKQS